jgi:hypothetical protein
MAGAEVSPAAVAELRSLLAATFLVSFQLLRVPETSNITNLDLLASLH